MTEKAKWQYQQCYFNCFSLKCLKKHAPILTWLPQYCSADLKSDLIAGISVGLTVIPQGLAYSQLVSLPPQYGLYTAFMACFIYTIFGSCKEITIGPTAVMCLLTAEYARLGGATYAVLLTFLCGCIQLLMGLLNLGFFIGFISAPVLSGFVSSAAIIIATSQLKGLLGLKFKSQGFIDTVHKLFINLPSINYWDSVLGSSCIILLLLIRYFKDKKFSRNTKLSSPVQKFLEGTWWSIVTGRNALLVMLCSGLVVLLLSQSIDVLTLTQQAEAGLPSFSIPSFTYFKFDNVTNATIHKSFSDIIKDLGSGIAVIPFVSVVEAIAIAKAISRGRGVDANQEIFALGLCNLMGSFVSSYPTTVSFSRTALNSSCGVRTPFGGVFTGTIVLLAIGVLAPYSRYIPKACLCSIVFSAVIFMIHYEDVPAMWKANKLDLFPYCATFFCSFFLGLEYGILIGVIVSLVVLIVQQTFPKVAVTVKMFNEAALIYVKPDRSIYFPTVEYLNRRIVKAIPDSVEPCNVTIIVDGSQLLGTDYTTAVGMKDMVENMKKQNITVAFSDLKVPVLKALSSLQQLNIQHNEDIEKENISDNGVIIEENILSDSLTRRDNSPQEPVSKNQITLNSLRKHEENDPDADDVQKTCCSLTPLVSDDSKKSYT